MGVYISHISIAMLNFVGIGAHFQTVNALSYTYDLNCVLIYSNGSLLYLSRKSSIGLLWLFIFCWKSSMVLWGHLHLKPYALRFCWRFSNRYGILLLGCQHPSTVAGLYLPAGSVFTPSRRRVFVTGHPFEGFMCKVFSKWLIFITCP